MRFNKLIPELRVFNFEKSLEFCTKILGFKAEYTREKFAFLSFNGSQIMIEEVNNHWKTGGVKRKAGKALIQGLEPDLRHSGNSLHATRVYARETGLVEEEILFLGMMHQFEDAISVALTNGMSDKAKELYKAAVPALEKKGDFEQLARIAALVGDNEKENFYTTIVGTIKKNAS